MIVQNCTCSLKSAKTAHKKLQDWARSKFYERNLKARKLNLKSEKLKLTVEIFVMTAMENPKKRQKLDYETKTIEDLPVEIILKIFDFVNIRDLFQCNGCEQENQRNC